MHRWCSWPPVSAVCCMTRPQQLTHVSLFACEHTVLKFVHMLPYRLYKRIACTLDGKDTLIYLCFFLCVFLTYLCMYISLCVRVCLMAWFTHWQMKETCLFVPLQSDGPCWTIMLATQVSTGCSECITHTNLSVCVSVCLPHCFTIATEQDKQDKNTNDMRGEIQRN